MATSTTHSIPRTLPHRPVFSVDTVVLGAGIVGLAVARALSYNKKNQHQEDHNITLIEQANTFGSATSSRNSGVIHAGIYYPPHSWKAKFCVRGKELAYAYCRERSIPVQQCGKLIVATQPSHVSTLQKLHSQAQANGVYDTRILTKEETLEKEPALNTDTLYAALYSPSTGIVDVHAWMEQLETDCCNNVTRAYHSSVDNARIMMDDNGGDDQHRIHLRVDGEWLSCRVLINCAGLWAPTVAQWMHTTSSSNQRWQPPRHYFAKGRYYRLDTSKHVTTTTPPQFSHLVYPVPDDGGLGIHATMDLQGQLRFGPDVEWIDPAITDPEGIDLNVPATCPDYFLTSIQTYWKGIQREALVPDYAGIRPKLSHPSLQSASSFQDFLIAGPETHGVKGLVHLFGIESPGVTSSMALAEHVARMVETGT